MLLLEIHQKLPTFLEYESSILGKQSRQIYEFSTFFLKTSHQVSPGRKVTILDTITGGHLNPNNINQHNPSYFKPI